MSEISLRLWWINCLNSLSIFPYMLFSYFLLILLYSFISSIFGPWPFLVFLWSLFIFMVPELCWKGLGDIRRNHLEKYFTFGGIWGLKNHEKFDYYFVWGMHTLWFPDVPYASKLSTVPIVPSLPLLASLLCPPSQPLCKAAMLVMTEMLVSIIFLRLPLPWHYLVLNWACSSVVQPQP